MKGIYRLQHLLLDVRMMFLYMLVERYESVNLDVSGGGADVYRMLIYRCVIKASTLLSA